MGADDVVAIRGNAEAEHGRVVRLPPSTEPMSQSASFEQKKPPTGGAPSGDKELTSQSESLMASLRRRSSLTGRFSLSKSSEAKGPRGPGGILRKQQPSKKQEATTKVRSARVRFLSISHSPVSNELPVARSPSSTGKVRVAPAPPRENLVGGFAHAPDSPVDEGSQHNGETLRELLQGEHVINGAALRHVRMLGSGTFGVVYQCRLLEPLVEPALDEHARAFVQQADGMVAVKKLRSDAQIAMSAFRSLTTEEIVEFSREIALMKALRHAHVLGYVGCGLYLDGEGHDQLSLVLEFAPHGSLAALINYESALRRGYGLTDALRWVAEIASGLAYLHGCRPQVIHRDLKPENVLLCGRSRVAKLADFGLATFARKRDSIRQVAVLLADHHAAIAAAGVDGEISAVVPIRPSPPRPPAQSSAELLRSRLMSDDPNASGERPQSPQRSKIARGRRSSEREMSLVDADEGSVGGRQSREEEEGRAAGLAHPSHVGAPQSHGLTSSGGRAALSPVQTPDEAPVEAASAAADEPPPVSPFSAVDGFHFDVAALKLTGTTGSLRYMVSVLPLPAGRAAAAASNLPLLPHPLPLCARPSGP